MAKKNAGVPQNVLRNAVRTLMSNICFADVDNPIKSIVVTSSIPNEGKSTVAYNLAEAFAASGKRTLIVEADMRRRTLAEIAGVDIKEFGMEMFKAGTSLVGKTVEEIFNQDYKKFSFGDLSVGVAQVNTMDIEGFAPYKEEMLAYMEKTAKDNNMEFTMLLLTDVINATSEAFVAGPHPEYVEEAFHIELVDKQASLPGVISRKKQVVPVITEALS